LEVRWQSTGSSTQDRHELSPFFIFWPRFKFARIHFIESKKRADDLKSELSSKERLLRSLNFEEPDHVPLLLRFFNRSYLMDKSQGWHNQFVKADQLIKLGFDETVNLSPPLPLNPEVKVKKWKVSQAEGECPLLVKEYETPKGVLRQVARQTPDWPHGDDVPIFSDFIIPGARTKKYLIENTQDLESLSCLFTKPSGNEINNFMKYAQRVKGFAEERSLLTESDGPMLGDGAMWLCGVERVVLATIRNPEFLHRLLEIIHDWDMMRIRLILEIGGADIIIHRGWYESPVFWSPKAYETFLAPLIREQVELVHRAGVKFGYIMTRKQTPLFKILKELEIDVLFGPDPVEGEVDILRMKKEIGDQICLWGGVNSFVTLEFGTKETVRDSVANAIRKLAPGSGFIFSVVDCITGEGAGTRETPLSSIISLINAWRELGSYSSRS